MKIKVVEKEYKDVVAMPKPKHIKPQKQNAFWRNVLYLASKSEVKAVNFQCNMKSELDRDQAYLFLMNHSSFTDLQIASKMLKDRQYHIVCTNDGFVGKDGLMRSIGCIPTKKFITDVTLVKDMKYAVDSLNSSILMFPEASYSFDGTETPLPASMGKIVKLLGIPVVLIRTRGAFLRDPLYNNLQKRRAQVSADVQIIVSKEDIDQKSVEEINEIINTGFVYDHFREQYEEGIVVNEEFRADGLHRALYKCPSCNTEGRMKGAGIKIACHNCSKSYVLLENGKLEAEGGNTTEFEFVPDWYKWQRKSVREEIEKDEYLLDIDVDILMLADSQAVYRVGEGHLIHNKNGFELTGCNGELHYTQKPSASYSLYADYFWYELGDMICIGDNNYQYYCFPKNQEKAIVAKARLATEELFALRQVR